MSKDKSTSAALQAQAAALKAEALRVIKMIDTIVWSD